MTLESSVFPPPASAARAFPSCRSALFTLISGAVIGLLAGLVGSAAAQTIWPPGIPGCADTLKISNIQDPGASCHPVVDDVVLGIRGIVIGFDPKASGFAVYIQNSHGGPFSGINVFTGPSNYQGILTLGDSVAVVGRVLEFPPGNGETELVDTDGSLVTNDLIALISSGNPLPPFQVLDPVQLNYRGALSELWEGCLVQVRGPLIVVRSTASAATTERGMPTRSFIVAPASDTTDVDSRVLVDGNTLATISAPTVGTVVDYVQGIPNQRTTFGVNTYRLQLRDNNDLPQPGAPSLVSAYPLAGNLLRLEFDRSVDVATASDISHYSMASAVSVASAVVENGSGRFVRVTLNQSLSGGVGDSIRCENIASLDCPSCPMTPRQARYFLGGILTVPAIQQADPTFMPGQDRSRFAGSGTLAGPAMSFRGVCTGVFGALYYVQDEVGGLRSGMAVFAPPSALVPGRTYLIAGAHIQEFNSETEAVLVEYIVDEGSGTIPPPSSVPIAVLANAGTGAGTGEDYEGMPVRIDAGRVEDAASAGGNFRLSGPPGSWSDLILVSNLNGVLNAFDPPDPPMIVTVDGILHQVTAGFQICPRSGAEVVPDLTAPETEITSGPAEGSRQLVTGATFNFSGSDNQIPNTYLRFSWQLDGGGFPVPSPNTTATYSGLTDGSHTFQVRAVDLNENADPSPATRTFRVHAQSPTVTLLTAPAEGAFESSAVETLTWTLGSLSADASRGATTWAYRLDGGAFSAESPDTFVTLDSLAEGSHTLVVRATDDAGLTGTAARTWLVDITPPNALITAGPAEGGWSNTASPTFTVSASDNVTPSNLIEFAYALDGASYGAFSTSTTISLSGISAGPHTLAVVARDAAGNTDATPAMRAWSSDAAPPETQLLSGPAEGSVVDGNGATLTFEGSDDTTPQEQLRFTATLDGDPLGAASAAVTISLTDLADGVHAFTVATVDLADNTDPTPATRGFTTDALPPEIVFIAGPAEGACVTQASMSITWSATDVVTPPGSIEHAWSLDGGAFTAYTFNTSASLNALSEGAHTLSVRSRDALGHVATANRMFRVDQSAPTVYLPTTLLLDSNTFRITCTGVDAGGIVSYRVQVSEDPAFASVLEDQTIGAAGMMNYTGVRGHNYYARAAAKDCAGNESAFSGASNGATIADLPDLVVTQVLVPPTATAGQVMGVSYTVVNDSLGGTNVPSWYDDLYLSPTPTFDGGTAIHLAQVTNLTFLGYSESYTVTRNVTLPLGLEGTYYVFVAADNGLQVPETNGGNNFGVSTAVTVELGNHANLVVTQVVAPPTALSSEIVTVSWTVQNQGNGRTNVDTWWDTVFLSDDPDFNYSVLGGGQIRMLDIPLGRVQRAGALESLAQYTKSMQVTIPSAAVGRKYILVASDLAADVQFQSVSESGNVFEHVAEINAASAESTVVTAQAPPDLVAEAAQITTPNVFSGGSFTANWTVRNSGFNPTPNTSWADQVWLSSDATLEEGSDLPMGTFSRGGVLPLSQAYTQTRVMELPNGLSGTYYMFVKTDVYDGVGEYLEDNNVVQAPGLLTVTLSSWPNLVPEAGATPDTAAAGDLALITWSVANYGVASTYGGWHDDVWISQSPTSIVGGFVAASVAAPHAVATEQSYSASASVRIPAHLGGRYYAHLVTDSRNELYEHDDESDNLLTLGSFHVRPYPAVDVALTAVSAGVTATQTGIGLPVTWTLTNVGLATTLNGSWNEEVWLSTDTSFGSDVFLANSYHGGLLGAGESYTRTITPTIPPGVGGVYYVIVRTLPSGIDDQSSANNVMAAAVPVTITSIPAPNLTVGDVTVAPTDTAGQPLTARWTVTNLGPGDVPDRTWFSQVYLSRDPLADGSDVTLGAVQGAANLASNAAEPESLVTSVPNWASGPYYIIVRTDSRNDLYEGGAESNNVAVSPPLIVYVPPSSDLVIQNVSVPPTATPGEPVTISYDIANVGVNPAVGSLQNGVYVSSNAVFASEEDPLVGIEVRSVNLPPGGLMHISQRVVLDQPITVNAAGGVTGALPPLTPGPYYAIVRANIRASIHELRADNNLIASATTLTADIPELALGIATPFPLASQQERYYKVTTPSGFDLRVSLVSDVPDATNEVLVAFGRTPTPTDFEFSSPAEFSASPTLVIPSTQAGVYYIRVRALSLGSTATSENDSLTARLLPFSVESYSPVSGGRGRVTMTVRGAGFRASSVVRLEQLGVSSTTSTMAEFVNTTHFRARLDLTDVIEGTYDLVVATEGEEILVPGGFQVATAQPMNIAVDVHNADVLRRTATGTFVVEFTNTSNHDIPVLTARILAHGASVLKKLETTQGLLSPSERFPSLRIPLSGDIAIITDCAEGDSLIAMDLVGANLAPGETRTATLGLAGFETSPYSVRVLVQASTVGEFLDREVASHESARLALLADPVGVPPDVLLLAGDAYAFRDSALVGNDLEPGIVSAPDLNAYLLVASAPSSNFSGPAGPQALLDEATVGNCSVPLGIPECVPDVSPVICALPGCVSVFCTSLRVPLAVGQGAGTFGTISGTSVQGFSETVCADARIVVPCDPNEITGPAGYGDQHWVNAVAPMNYRVDFENLPPAAAPAQVVRVSVPLDPDLDPTSFRLGSFGFGTHVIDLAAGYTSFSDDFYFSDLGLVVRVTCGIDLVTMSANWTFTSIDPATGLQPTNPYVGFLPVSQSGTGKGFTTFTVKPRSSAATGTGISAQASIKFDINAPLATTTTANKVDNGRPTSIVAQDPVVIDSTRVRVAWQKSDANGAGVAGVTLFMRRDHGALEQVATGLTGSELEIPVTPGHFYFFRSQATDHSGNVEPEKAGFDVVVPVGAIPLDVATPVGPRATLLFGAAPNPFSNTTNVRFDLAGAEAVTLEVFDVQGRLVQTVLDGKRLQAGHHSAAIRALSSGTGVYFLRMRAGSYSAVRRMVMLR